MDEERSQHPIIPVSDVEEIFRLEKYKNIEDVLKQNLKCTVCMVDLSNLIIARLSCHLHRVLKVLVCKKCKKFYGDGYLSTEEDGSPKFCRWCGDGGNMFLCDRCNNGFCKPCVRRNFSRAYFQQLQNVDGWSCFICSPEVLYDLRATAWAVRELCKMRREEEKNKNGSKRGHTRRKFSSLENSFISMGGGENLDATTSVTTRQPSQDRRADCENSVPLFHEDDDNECENSNLSETGEMDFPTRYPHVSTKSRKTYDRNPVLLQAREDMKKFFSLLSDLQKREKFFELKNEIFGDYDCDSFLVIERLELMMQEFIIGLIEELNKCSTDISSRLTQLRRLYMIEEDVARRNGGFGGDCSTRGVDEGLEHEKVDEKCEEMDIEQHDSDEDDVLSISSESSCFSSVSNSRHVREGRLDAVNYGDSDDTRTGFSMVNLTATSTPSKEKEKQVAVKVEKMEEEKEEDNDRTLCQDEYAMKLLGIDEDSDANDEEENVIEEEEKEASIKKGGVFEDDEENVQTKELLIEREGIEDDQLEEEEEEEEEEEDVDDEDKENRNENVERTRSGGEGDGSKETENNVESCDDSDLCRKSVLKKVEDCQKPTVENKTDLDDIFSDKGSGFSENYDFGDDSDASNNCDDDTIDDRVTSDRDPAVTSSDSDAATVFEVDNDRTTNGENKKPKADGETASMKDEEESEQKKMESEDDRDWDVIRRLSDLGTLERKRKHSNSNSEDSGCDKTEKRTPKKRTKKSEEKYDILENLNDSSHSKEGDKDDTDDEHDYFSLKLGKNFQNGRTVGFESKLAFSDSGENSDKNSSCNSGNENDETTSKTECKGNKEIDNDDGTTDSDWEVKRTSPLKRPSWRRDGLLTGKLSSSDEESKKVDERRKEERKRKKKRKAKSMFIESETESECGSESENDDCEILSDTGSDSSIQFVTSKSKRSRRLSSTSSILSIHSILDDDDDSKSRKKSRKFKRKKGTKINIDLFSSDSSENGSSCEEVANSLNTSSQSQGMSGQGRRNIRRVMKDEDVTEATRRAIKEEEERKQRVLDRQQKYNDSFGISDGSAPIGDRLVLDFDTNTKKELICVDEDLVSQMKPHQALGVKFMWDACFESLEAIKDGEGGGCILAHCMGLGKTFQVVSLVHTLLMHRRDTKVRRVLICCPLSTVLNWHYEFQKWLSKLSFSKRIAVHHLANDKTMNRRVSRLKNWHNEGGVMIIGYDMFRSLTNEDKKVVKSNYKSVFSETLLKPGADLVICDEGHTLKNLKTALSQQMNKIETRRRIVLTGTPLQNNLIEYHCMMNFVKPNYLGTRKEFVNRFVNPITNGQFADSTEYDVKVMKRRAHVLHKMLDGLTQRRDYRELMPYLPPKQEYVMSIRLTELQISLMRTFLEKVVVTKQLFKDYQSLSRLWSHPLTLKYSMDRIRKKPENDGKVGDIDNAFNDHSNDSDVQFISNCNNEVTVTTSTAADKKEDEEKTIKEGESGEKEEWWEKLVSEEQMCDVTVSSKLVLLFAFLKQCETIGDKLLIFSQSLASLDVIEYFLNRLDQQSNSSDKENAQQQQQTSSVTNWKKGVDYFRLDGSTSSENREKSIKAFNKPSNRARLFLISTKAGGLGINLTAANRVILFDASWNPSNDIQSIFRVFRFGQDKPCYIYRFIAQGTMEEKIYERQISKLSLSIRVVDEQQVNRYYSQTDLQALYRFTPADPSDRPIPIVPKDRLLCDMLEEHSSLIYKVFMHDSLLDHVEEEELDEEEQKAAWEDYKNEKKNAINLDRIQSSSIQTLPAQDVDMLMKKTIPAQDVEIMKQMLLRKYANIPPQILNVILTREVEAWKRSRIAQLASGAPVSGPSTSGPSTSASSTNAPPTNAVTTGNIETINLME